MGATVEYAGARTIVRLTPGSGRVPQFRRAYFRAYRAARIVAGRCGVCGRKRRHYTQRCDTCQRRERKRWAARYPEGNWTWFDQRRAVYRQRDRQRARVQRFIARLDAMTF
jgi:hypothetical protein